MNVYASDNTTACGQAVCSDHCIIVCMHTVPHNGKLQFGSSDQWSGTYKVVDCNGRRIGSAFRDGTTIVVHLNEYAKEFKIVRCVAFWCIHCKERHIDDECRFDDFRAIRGLLPHPRDV